MKISTTPIILELIQLRVPKCFSVRKKTKTKHSNKKNGGNGKNILSNLVSICLSSGIRLQKLDLQKRISFFFKSITETFLMLLLSYYRSRHERINRRDSSREKETPQVGLPSFFLFSKAQHCQIPKLINILNTEQKNLQHTFRQQQQLQGLSYLDTLQSKSNPSYSESTKQFALPNVDNECFATSALFINFIIALGFPLMSCLQDLH